MDVPLCSTDPLPEGEGNTKTSPQSGGARYKSNAKNWVMTLFDFKLDDWKLTLDPCSTISNNQFIVGLEVCPKTENLHLQCFIHFDKKVRAFDKLKALYPTAHIEVAKGNIKQNIRYCSKDGKFFSTFPEDTSVDYMTNDDVINYFQKFYPDGCRRQTLYKHIYKCMFDERRIRPIRDPRQQKIFCDMIFDFVNTAENFDWFSEHYPTLPH